MLNPLISCVFRIDRSHYTEEVHLLWRAEPLILAMHSGTATTAVKLQNAQKDCNSEWPILSLVTPELHIYSKVTLMRCFWVSRILASEQTVGYLQANARI